MKNKRKIEAVDLKQWIPEKHRKDLSKSLKRQYTYLVLLNSSSCY